MIYIYKKYTFIDESIFSQNKYVKFASSRTLYRENER